MLAVCMCVCVWVGYGWLYNSKKGNDEEKNVSDKFDSKYSQPN